MNLFIDAILWIFSPDRLQTGSYDPLAVRLGEHLFYTFVSVVIAVLIAVPIGWRIGHTGRGREIAVGITGAARALPSFGLIILLVLLIGVTRTALAATIAFVVLAIPSILAGAYAGIEAIDRRTVDAARAVGMSEWQILWKVEVPLGLPLLIGGIRAAALQVVATATLAGFVGLGGLGLYIIAGIQLRRFDQVLGGAILVAVLALAIDAIFAILQRVVVPTGVAAGRAGADASKEVRTPATRRRAAVGPSTTEGRGT